MDRFYGCAEWSHELRQYIIKETGLPVSMGLSINKTVSKIATGEAKPNGEIEVKKEIVLPFLDPLSIRKIPMIGQKTYHTLRSMGIQQYTPSEIFRLKCSKNLWVKMVWRYGKRPMASTLLLSSAIRNRNR